MAGRSASRVGLISRAGMGKKYFCPTQKKSPGAEAGASILLPCQPSVALAEQLQQQREQVDEVQVERECARNRRTLGNVTALRGIAVDVVVLQPLGIPGGEAREHHDADHRDDELQHRPAKEKVDEAGDDDAD